ncbi:Protein of uncharacterised function (DUF2622) [Klebsiella pneumoniae subsp. ozaenae]|uniref:Protein of uncharacterized function (DUF2622) n=1 Tax=Klebsiella pneumoniae subsp. ozaenae TaxID=574 RepID=A0A377ZHV6_KLEPO|nr:Protein of uncharacterised function (DUF2622) [Klebsiella pneumoniae subsp. ozaenae]
MMKRARPHELGTNTFGLLSGQTAEEVKALSAGLAEAALGRPAEIAVAHSPSG